MPWGRIVKLTKPSGVIKIHYRPFESYRFDNSVRHEPILHLGTLEQLPGVEQKRSLLIRTHELIKQSHTGKKTLFIPDDTRVETLAQHFFALIQEKQRIDIAAGKDYQSIDTDTVKNKNIREADTEWLCMQAFPLLTRLAAINCYAARFKLKRSPYLHLLIFHLIILLSPRLILSAL